MDIQKASKEIRDHISGLVEEEDMGKEVSEIDKAFKAAAKKSVSYLSKTTGRKFKLKRINLGSYGNEISASASFDGASQDGIRVINLFLEIGTAVSDSDPNDVVFTLTSGYRDDSMYGMPPKLNDNVEGAEALYGKLKDMNYLWGWLKTQ